MSSAESPVGTAADRAQAHVHDAGALTRCANCDFSFAERNYAYCPSCGQETKAHLPGFWAYLHEWLTHYVAVEGKLWRTLWILFAHPGQLTRDYLAGRRQRYIRPFRLYFSISLVFFLFVKVAGWGQLGDELKRLPQLNAAPAPFEVNIGNDWGWFEPVRARIQEQIDRQNQRIAAVGTKAALLELGSAIMKLLPYALFLYLPAYAGVLQFVYRDRQFSYGEHMVASLNVYSMFFFGLLMLSFVPWFWLQLAIAIWMGLHVTLDMKRVYGDSWAEVSRRSNLVGLLSLIPMALMLFVVAIIAAVSQ